MESKDIGLDKQYLNNVKGCEATNWNQALKDDTMIIWHFSIRNSLRHYELRAKSWQYYKP